MKFWTKLKKWAEKKEREAFLAAYRCDQMCPHCKTWQGNCGGWKSWRDDGQSPDAHHAEATCGKCGQKSYWFMEGMQPMAISHEFNPLGLTTIFLPKGKHE